MVICLERGADLHIPSWCHCHSLSLASVKSRLVFPFWYRLTRVVLDKGLLFGSVCISTACIVCVAGFSARIEQYLSETTIRWVIKKFCDLTIKNNIL